MDDSTGLVDVQKLLAFGDDILLVLRNQKDADALSHSLDASNSLRSHCDQGFRHTQTTLEEYQERVAACKRRISEVEVEGETISDVELGVVEKSLEEELELEELLLQELRAVEDELADLEKRWVSLEEREAEMRREQKDAMRSSELLSMCASTTNIIPNLEDQTRISGYILDRNKKKCAKFEFEQSLSSTEICNKLWAMVE